MTQKQRLLGLLADRKWHSNVEILDDLRIWRVAARIQNLEDDGHVIETKNGEGPLYFYRLVKSAQQVARETAKELQTEETAPRPTNQMKLI